MSNFWKDRLEIHKSEQVTGTAGGDGYASVCGNLDRDPELRETRLRSEDDVEILVEARFGISIPSITPDVQECVAYGALAARIGEELKQGRRIRVIGRYVIGRYSEPVVVVHSATRRRIRSIPG
jgi:Single-strand binding protein family